MPLASASSTARAHLAKDRRIHLRISALRQAGAWALHHNLPSAIHPDIHETFAKRAFLPNSRACPVKCAAYFSGVRLKSQVSHPKTAEEHLVPQAKRNF